MAPPTCCSVTTPVWQQQYIGPSALKRGDLRAPYNQSVESRIFLERQPQQLKLRDGAYRHRLIGRRQSKGFSSVSAKASVSVVEEREASSVYRGDATGQKTDSVSSGEETGVSLFKTLVLTADLSLHSKLCILKAQSIICLACL